MQQANLSNKYMVLRHSIKIIKIVPAIGLYGSECKIEFIAVKIGKIKTIFIIMKWNLVLNY